MAGVFNKKIISKDQEEIPEAFGYEESHFDSDFKFEDMDSGELEGVFDKIISGQDQEEMPEAFDFEENHFDGDFKFEDMDSGLFEDVGNNIIFRNNLILSEFEFSPGANTLEDSLTDEQ